MPNGEPRPTTPVSTEATPRWYVMRDLKRTNAKEPAYKMLTDLGLQTFTPLHTVIVQQHGKRVKLTRPVISDLLFVREASVTLDPIVDKTPTLQYRYVKGGAYCQPMVVSDSEMDRFIAVVSTGNEPRIFSPDEITESMLGREIKIVGGVLNGLQGHLLSLRGSRKRRLVVKVANVIAASAVVEPEFIEFI